MLLGACLRRELLQLLIIITKYEFVHSVAVTSWTEQPLVTVSLLQYSWKWLSPQGKKEMSLSGRMLPKRAEKVLVPGSCNSRAGLFHLFC